LTFFSDEEWFHLQGHTNTQNNRYWSSQNPHLTHEILLHPVKVGVRCARSIVRPLFFNETINCERYVQVILGKFFPELSEEERLHGRFQQDSAFANIAYISMQALSNVFRERIINSDIWPTRLPELNNYYFYFRGCSKDKVYNSNPQTEEKLEENIYRETANIPAEQLQTVNWNVFHQCEESLHAEGQHFQHFV
jgi:hypothetical protein